MNPIDAAEAELQQELREMFIVDTQQNLEAYFEPIQRLNPQSWTADIQQLYRAIHTIKGGAVTVAADAMLQAAIALEDLLSDLRYLEVAPVLTDGELAQILLEAGELLSSSIEITETGDRATVQVWPTVNRLKQLHERVKRTYLPDWNELKQVHHEFAEQGFDLVILDLEMALAALPPMGVVPGQTIAKAEAMLSQLTQIGMDIELAEDWTILLQDSQELVAKPDCQLWTSAWFEYFELLKICVKNSGTLPPEQIARLDTITMSVKATNIESESASLELQSNVELSDSLDLFFCEDEESDSLLAMEDAIDATAFHENLVDMLDDFFLEEEEVEFIEINEPSIDRDFAISSEVSSNLIEDLDRNLLTAALDWNVAADIQLDPEAESTIELDFDTLTQSSLELEDIDRQFATSAPDFDTLTQGTIDLNFDTLTQSSLELSDLDLDTLTRSILSLEDISSNLETSDPDFDTLDQSTLDPDLDTLTQSTLTIDEFFNDPEKEAGSQNIEADSYRSLASIDELAQSESIEYLPDSCNELSVDRSDIYSLNEAEDFDREEGALLSKAEVDILTKESIDRLSTFATAAVLDPNAFTTASESQLLDTDRAELAITANNPTISSAPSLPALPAVAANTSNTTNPVAPVKRSVQIPVPLERLDKSAQQVVETLLTARAVTSISAQLQSQLSQLTILTRENSQFVTRLRQLQDDYALLRNLSDEKQDSGNNVTLERYRQGYSTIVRLLENILRLSELGQEIESSTYQSAIRLDALDRSIIQLKDGIEASRLVPFRNLTLRAKAILRDLTNRYGKPAELIVENEHIELDAGIVQQLEPALLHLLRNAYDHGLEPVQQRLDAGKSERGKIQISLHQQGNMYLLTIEDDGGGIDAELIHNLAKSKGFNLNQTRTNAELLAVLCQPGFSSSNTISEVSGRGVGMDVVVSQIDSIGGRLTLQTFPGYGSKFTIEVPAPQLLIPCILFQVGDRTIALPMDNVLETALLHEMQAEPLETPIGLCAWKLTDRRGEIPGFDLHKYWQPGNVASQRTFPDTAICIRTRQAADTPEIWAIADDSIGQAKLLINPLPSPLIAPVGLLGVSLQPDGRLISILDPIALSATIVSATPSATIQPDELTTPADRATDLTPSAPTILIVDDAALIRRRLESSLNTYGFITHTCNDGLEALNWLQTNPQPDLMITDVEMPNMDGFTLIDRLRQAKIAMPILVVSSRSSEEWGKEARRLGATDYLNKGFATSEMIQKVNLLLGLVVT